MTPTARVLWDADALNATEVRDAATCQRAVAHARQFSALNESQAAAVGQAASRALSVIWGPPGTGKTNTCAALVHGIVAAEVLRRRQYSILLSGPTYKAVGELVERVVSSLAKDPAVPCRLYLVYSKSRPDRFPLPAQVPDHVTIIEALSERTAREFQQMRDDLETGQGVVIVAAVTHQCARISEQFSRMTGAPGVMHELFDFVLIDETSQVDIATAVMPLALLKSTFQIVVAGDHLQMPPIVATEPPLGAEYLVGSLQRYLAERFRIEPTPLLLNYRSNQNIVDYIRRLGYPPELQAAYPQTAIALLEDPAGKKESMESAGLPWSDGWLRIVDPERPIVGVTYPDGTAGQANVFEARCVVSVVWLLRQCSSRFLAGRPDTPEAHEPWTDEGFWTEGVGIVTPHRAQRAQVVRELMAAFPNVDPLLIEGAVDTVERFQGGQRNTILISFGVGDPDVIRGEERFLLQLERTNVALSRAMGKCIVFLSDDVANHIPDDRDAAATAHALRGVIDEWCIHRQSAAVEFEGRARTLTVRWR